MALDGIFINKLCAEIAAAAADTRIDKIYQPSREEIIFNLRGKGHAEKLLVSIKGGSSRLGLINRSVENPPSPPMFCMLLRKNLSGARFIAVRQQGYERVVCFDFETRNEMQDTVVLTVIAELLGSRSNIILTDGSGRIIDCIRRSDIEAGGRLVQPGARYEPPVREEKAVITNAEIEPLAQRIFSSPFELCTVLVELLDGVSPLIAREICFLANLSPNDRGNLLSPQQRTAFTAALSQFKAAVSGQAFPTVVTVNGVPTEFSYTDITQYGASAVRQHPDSLSAVVDGFYKTRADRERMAQASGGLRKTVANLETRAARKLAARKSDLKKCEKRDTYRIYGELIKANIHSVKKGVSSALLQNYYDPDLTETEIPLDPALSPAENAQKYFKKYKKACVAAGLLTELIKDSEQELFYIKSVAEELDRAESLAELEAIAEELRAGGYIKSHTKSAKKPPRLKPHEFISPDGFSVLVGRNNCQNDELTTKIAAKTDLWLHTKDIHGSHVVILCGGKTPPERTVVFAAQKAAYFSKARNSSSVPVDCVPVKYVKKPSGAGAGMVVFTNNRTLYVEPKGPQDDEGEE